MKEIVPTPCRLAEARDNTYYSRRIFMKTWKKASVLFFAAALILSVLYVPKISVAKSKRATPPNAKHYALGDIKSVKLKGSTVTIKADFKKNSKYQTKKFRISSKTKFYHAEEWRNDFEKEICEIGRNRDERSFPIHSHLGKKE